MEGVEESGQRDDLSYLIREAVREARDFDRKAKRRRVNFQVAFVAFVVLLMVLLSFLIITPEYLKWVTSHYSSNNRTPE
ncbi:hypothetical protein HOP50_14g71390 [Chloropicon primus]|nr:hypothetical protein HOP50_14g71390 [Chloropicon primus]